MSQVMKDLALKKTHSDCSTHKNLSARQINKHINCSGLLCNCVV